MITGVIFFITCILCLILLVGRKPHEQPSLQGKHFGHLCVVSDLFGLIQYFVDQIWFLVTLRPRGLLLPPSLTGKLPIVGNAYLLAGNSEQTWKALQIFTKHSMKHGGVGLAHLGTHNFFTITDPDDANTIANSHFDKTYVYDFARPWLHDGLITAKASLWKPHRKLLAPAFSSSTLNMFLPIINENAKNLVAGLSAHVNKGYFDPIGLLNKNLLNNICRTLFNLENTDKTVIDDYSDAAESILKIFSRRFGQIWLHIPFVYQLSSLRRKADKLIEHAVDISKNIIDIRKLRRKTNKSNNEHELENFRSILDFMLETDEKLNVYTDEEIQAHLNTLTVAALDTTISAMISTLVLVGSYPEVQEKIQYELQQVFEGSTRDVDKYDLSKLVYLEAVVKEGLRLYPPVPFVLRSSNIEVKLKNYTLPANGTYALSLHGLNRHPIWGPDAEQFRPERWLEPDSLPVNPNTFTPFSIGKRNCIAKHYSLMFLKVTFAHVLRSYRVTGDISKVVMKWDVTLRPKEGHKIALENI